MGYKQELRRNFTMIEVFGKLNGLLDPIEEEFELY